MPETNHDIILHRYPGVKPFSTSENFLFFGRQTDIEALNTLIFIKQTVVLYGKSGYGKSSLINAGIIPKLKENNSWTYFSIRFNNFSGKETEQNVSPTQTVKQRLSGQIILNEANILDRLIPKENSFWYWIKQHQSQNTKTNYIFFFDQFEELFTYPKEQVNEFSEQLSEVLYDTLPLKFKKKIAETDENNLINNAEHEFLYEKPEIKVVFSIRSDRLSLLNTLTDKHPAILQHCYELNALNVSDAQQAIIEPAKLSKDLGFKTSPFNFTEKAIDVILKSVANPLDGKIEAATLQIVCRYIEDSLVEIKNQLVIDENNLGDITDIFQQYYQSILNRLSDDERIKAQHLIEDELIDGDRRNALSEGSIKKTGVPQSLLIRLEQTSLLRKERNASGMIFYEISHDSLISAIGRVAEARRRDEDDLKKIALEKQIIEERKRAEELESLNKKAVFRYKLAVGLVVVSLVTTLVAWSYKIKSDEAEKDATIQEQNAKNMERIAIESEKIARKAQYEAEKATARIFLEKGDSYFDDYGENGISEARIYYDSASKYMMKYKSDSLYQIIQSKIDLCIKNTK